jgi:hypothetical protein
MDAADDLAAGAKALIVDPTVNGNPTPSTRLTTRQLLAQDVWRLEIRTAPSRTTRR